ncbi:Crp/Fnr family transcriptional regulator [Maribacter sp. HTCC2170]|uniref:Crp/Fnr family transcriptional regulator n=1 Tax=Maribacter sp. (strain HTCC2170 / KCCM 42371) TaxID=313603 RepID=UPI00006AFDA3|nr:Crp/Fnr family transcriptional regulator [Maribacter sp. HTCC2170]EAR01362.1 transcriptional regulator, Crp family protein [Maribacter sp. HTCC2170]
MKTQNPIHKKKLKAAYKTIFEAKFINEILVVSEYTQLKKGELLIDIGDEMTHIPLLLSGVVKIIRKEKKKELSLYYLKKGDTCAISFANCINNKKSIFKGVVEEDVEIFLLPVNKIDEWLIKYDSWRYYIIDSYHFRLLEMVGSIDNLAFLKMKDRVLNYLIGKLHTTNLTSVDVTHQEIANDLNTSRVVVTRLLKELEQEGEILMKRHKIEVLEK